MNVLLPLVGIAVVVFVIGLLIKNRRQTPITPTDKSIKQPNPNEGKSDRKDEAIKKYKASKKN